MPVPARPAIAVGVFAAYTAIVLGFWFGFDVDYGSVQDSRTGILEGIVLPIGLGAVTLAVVTSVLGWWGPAIREPRSAATPRWAWVTPALIVGAVLLSATGIDLGSDRADLLPWIAFGVLLVGFSEELLTRGLLLVGLRGGGLSPRTVWLVSSALFALLHGINALAGQSVGATVLQMVSAFLVGSAFLVTRYAAGTLLVPMVLHALWDFATLSTQATGGEADVLAGLSIWVIGVVALVTMVRITRTRATVEGSFRGGAPWTSPTPRPRR